LSRIPPLCGAAVSMCDEASLVYPLVAEAARLEFQELALLAFHSHVRR
jgi:hypothetical protein